MTTKAARKEEECAVLHAAEHGGEGLRDDEGEQHVLRGVDARTSGARLQRLDLSRVQPVPLILIMLFNLIEN